MVSISWKTPSEDAASAKPEAFLKGKTFPLEQLFAGAAGSAQSGPPG